MAVSAGGLSPGNLGAIKPGSATPPLKADWVSSVQLSHPRSQKGVSAQDCHWEPSTDQATPSRLLSHTELVLCGLGFFTVFFLPLITKALMRARQRSSVALMLRFCLNGCLFPMHTF